MRARVYFYKGPVWVYRSALTGAEKRYPMQQHKQMIPDGAAQGHAQDPLHAHQGRRGKYGRFLLMILVSTVLMHLMTYANSYEVGHIYFSVTRLYMSLMMGAVMAVVMLLFMWKMYPDKTKNAVIILASAAVFVAAFWMMRSQTFIGDIAWMRAMIPHHSIAILTSENASLKDPEVQQLAMRIIEAQRQEITEMQALLEKLGGMR